MTQWSWPLCENRTQRSIGRYANAIIRWTSSLSPSLHMVILRTCLSLPPEWTTAHRFMSHNRLPTVVQTFTFLFLHAPLKLWFPEEWIVWILDSCKTVWAQGVVWTHYLLQNELFSRSFEVIISTVSVLLSFQLLGFDRSLDQTADLASCRRHQISRSV